MKLHLDVISTGDYQSTKKKYNLSRRLLELIFWIKFPALIIERSLLITKGIDLVKSVSQQNYAAVLFSVSYVDSVVLKSAFESKSPSIKLRFKAIKALASQNILPVKAFMPILPYIVDTESDLEKVIKITATSGGSFVLGGVLTLSGYQKERYLGVTKEKFTNMLSRYEVLYRGNYGPTDDY